MMYPAYKLNKHSDIIEPWCTPFLIWNQSVAPCSVLTVVSWPAYRFLKSRSGGLVFPSLDGNFSQFVVIHTVKIFGVVNKAKVDVFLELSSFFNDPADVGNLTSGSSAFSKSSLNIWKFMVHILLRPGLEDFELYFTSKWDECNCAVVWAFFGITFLLDWYKTWPFPGLWPLLSFQICCHIEYIILKASSFRIWNSSTGIPSSLLTLFVWWFLSPTWLHIPGCLALSDHTIVFIWVIMIFFV